jgi:hypothetical protein
MKRGTKSPPTTDVGVMKYLAIFVYKVLKIEVSDPSNRRKLCRADSPTDGTQQERVIETPNIAYTSHVDRYKKKFCGSTANPRHNR